MSLRYITKKRLGISGLSAVLALFAAACNNTSDQGAGNKPPEATPAAKPATAKAVIEGRSNSKLTGEAVFTEAGGKVTVAVNVKNAPPGMHAVHIHEKGDCSAPDAASALGHFNPDNHKHGAPNASEHHAGDFGNMEVKADGTGELTLTTELLSVSAGNHSVVGRAIIIHEKPDDFVTQPTGNAGGRIGCGEIKT